MIDEESHIQEDAERKLILVTVVCCLFIVGEVVGGYIAGSLAIMTDAAHLLSDVFGFMVSLFCLQLVKRGATSVHSFGFKRAEVLGALMSVMLIWFITGVLLWEAINRVIAISNNTLESPVNGKIMLIIASLGLGCNLFIMLVLGHGHSHFGGSHGHSHEAEEGGSHGHSHEAGGGGSHGHSHEAGGGGSHGHSHEAGGGGSHGHSHSTNSENTPLLKFGGTQISSYSKPTTISSSHGHSHDGDDHGHSHSTSSSSIIRNSVLKERFAPTWPIEAGYEINALSVTFSPAAPRQSIVDQESGETVQQQQLQNSSSSSFQGMNINIQSAYVHAIGDVIQSVGVIVAGFLIWWFPYETHPMMQLADPITTFLFSILVLWSTNGILKSSVLVLMEGVPKEIDSKKVYKGLAKIPGVISIHDLHIWSLSLGQPFLSVHIVILAEKTTTEKCLSQAQHFCRSEGIHHCTIQIEIDGVPKCETEECVGCDGYVEDTTDCHAATTLE